MAKTRHILSYVDDERLRRRVLIGLNKQERVHDMARDISFGHLVAGYGVPLLDDAMIDQVVSRTPGASAVYFHRKAIEKPVLHALEARFAARGLASVREADLVPLATQQSY